MMMVMIIIRFQFNWKLQGINEDSILLLDQVFLVWYLKGFFSQISYFQDSKNSNQKLLEFLNSVQIHGAGDWVVKIHCQLFFLLLLQSFTDFCTPSLEIELWIFTISHLHQEVSVIIMVTLKFMPNLVFVLPLLHFIIIIALYYTLPRKMGEYVSFPRCL